MKPVLLFFLLPAVASADFDSYWHDGKAELNGYQIKVSRYGETREGKAVAIYVTEPFSESERVKVDDPKRGVDALKLNLVRDFQTGIYDYNTMVSVFVRTRDFSPLKITFTSAEWCGHVFEELIFTPRQVTGVYKSYFEGETGTRSLAWPKAGIAEDALWILLRNDFLKDGERKTVPMLTGAYYGRLAHKSPSWVEARIERAGLVYTVAAGDRTGKFEIEPEYPHRIRRWEMWPDLSAELTGSTRLEYWKLHRNGDERYLKQLGIEP